VGAGGILTTRPVGRGTPCGPQGPGRAGPPSAEDILLTRRMAEAGDVAGVQLVASG
jgi:hypothetical protein